MTAISGELSVLLVLAGVIFASPYLSKISKIPISPVEIILGIIAGSFGLLNGSEMFKSVAEIGFVYLMFLAGLEIDLRALRKIKVKTIWLCVIYLALLYSIAVICGVWMEPMFLVITVLPVMSVGVLSTLFKEYGKSELWLNIAMITGCMGEVISIALLSLAGAWVEYGAQKELFYSIYYLLLFMVLCVIVFKGLGVLFWWYPELKTALMPHADKDEKDIRLVVGAVFTVSAVMLYMGLETVLGAFIAGSVIATFFEHKKDLPHKLSSFGFGFLVPIFFVYIGSTVKLDALLEPGVFLGALGLAGAMMGARVLVAVAFFRVLGLGASLLFGLALSMPLTLLVATARLFYDAGHISDMVYSSFIVAAILEAVVAMILIKALMALKTRLHLDLRRH